MVDIKTELAELRAELIKEARRKVVTVIVAGCLAIIAAIAVAAWGVVTNVPYWLGTVPQGAVVAFATKADVNDEDAQCPIGWRPFKEGKGRVLIGAGVPSIDELKWWQRAGSFEKLPLSTYQPFAAGGEESHVLTLDQMPSHSHDLSSLHGIQVAGESNSRAVAAISPIPGSAPFTGNATQEVGGKQPFSLIPPYIALYYCRKS